MLVRSWLLNKIGRALPGRRSVHLCQKRQIARSQQLPTPLAFPLSLSLPCSWQCWQGPQKITTIGQALFNEARKFLVGADKQVIISGRSKEIVRLRSALNYHASSDDELL